MKVYLLVIILLFPNTMILNTWDRGFVFLHFLHLMMPIFVIFVAQIMNEKHRNTKNLFSILKRVKTELWLVLSASEKRNHTSVVNIDLTVVIDTWMESSFFETNYYSMEIQKIVFISKRSKFYFHLWWSAHCFLIFMLPPPSVTGEVYCFSWMLIKVQCAIFQWICLENLY